MWRILDFLLYIESNLWFSLSLLKNPAVISHDKKLILSSVLCVLHHNYVKLVYQHLLFLQKDYSGFKSNLQNEKSISFYLWHVVVTPILKNIEF